MYFNKRSCARLWLLTYLLVIIMLAACSPSPPQSAPLTKQPTQSPKPSVGAPHCHPQSPITSSTLGIPEVRGTTSGNTELWALLFQSLVAKQEVKIVWRMTGNGDMQVVAQGPYGESVRPKWLTPHDGSNWNRPGAEWGTGFILPGSGCWDFHVSRGDASGDVWVLVK